MPESFWNNLVYSCSVLLCRGLVAAVVDARHVPGLDSSIRSNHGSCLGRLWKVEQTLIHHGRQALLAVKSMADFDSSFQPSSLLFCSDLSNRRRSSRV